MAQIVAKQVSFYLSITLANWGSYSVLTVLTALTHEGVQIMKTADIILEDSLKKNNIIAMKLLNT